MLEDITMKTFSLLIALCGVTFTAVAAENSADKVNLIGNGDFQKGKIGHLPDGWDLVTPNKVLAPHFELKKGANHKQTLMASGNGRLECFGYARYPVKLEANKSYRMKVKLRVEGIEDLNRHVVHSVNGTGFNDGITTLYHKQGDLIIGENRFPGPKTATDCEIRLYYRFSPKGKVFWDEVALEECEPIPPRLVKIACGWGKGDMESWSQWLDSAGRKHVDIALLTESFNNKHTAEEGEPLDGPAGALMKQKAQQWKMYVTGTFYEKRDDLVFNSAPLFDRKGKLVGIYEKGQLFDPEEHIGITPGKDYPVFATDFGKVGIITCYDSWFPETTRLLAYKGAELVVLPNAGYCMDLMPARAADNGVCIAVSSENCPAGVWDSGGALAGEKSPTPTRYVESSICGYEKDEKNRLLVVTVDLSKRFSPHWWGGPMLSAPGGRRVRQTNILPIEDEIAHEAKRWLQE